MTDHDLERRLRQALHDDASSITPSDRRQVIEALAHEGATRSGRSRWLTPVSGAAAAAVVVTIPVVILVLLFQRRIVAGLTSGAA